jgi:hypothetical protein
MDAYVQSQVRELITATDQLSRIAYAENAEPMSEVFASIRTTLQRIDRVLGAPGGHASIEGDLDLVYQRIADVEARANATQKAEIARSLALAEALRDHVHPMPALLLTRPAQHAAKRFDRTHLMYGAAALATLVVIGLAVRRFAL